MALVRNQDYVFAPHVDVIMDKACFVGTEEHLFLVPDEAEKLPQSFREFMGGALSRTSTIESLDLGGKTPREVIAGLLEAPDMTLDELTAFFEGLKGSWDAVQVVKIAELVKLKVRAGMCGGSVTYKAKGNFGYTAMVTKIPKPESVEVQAFYAEAMAQVNA